MDKPRWRRKTFVAEPPDSSLLLTILFVGEQGTGRAGGMGKQTRSAEPAAMLATDLDSNALLDERLTGTFRSKARYQATGETAMDDDHPFDPA